MKSIDEMRSELSKIPFARWSDPLNPFERPNIFGNSNQLIEKVEGYKNGDPFFDGEQKSDYPDWLEEEFLHPMDQAIQERGIEALAWYVSFHVTQSNWGIFIPISSLVYIEKRYLKSLRRSRYRKWQLAFELLFEHELFHFVTDYACSQWELLVHRPCWSSLTERRIKAGRYLEVEEKLANAYMIRVLRQSWTPSIEASLKGFVESQPTGYCEAFDFIDENRFNEELRELVKSYIGLHAVEQGLNLHSDVFDFKVFFPITPRIESQQCPLHIIHDEGKIGIPHIAIEFIECIPKIIELCS